MPNKIITDIDHQNVYKDINTPTPTSAGDGANKAYVDSVAGSSRTLVGAFDASGGVFPTVGLGPAGAIVAGNFWYISVAGTLGTKILKAGDELVALINNAAVDADFFAIEKNEDQATTSTLGLVALAVAADINTGTDAQKATTAAAIAGADFRKKFTATFGDGAASTFTFTHNFGTQTDIQAGIVDAVSPWRAKTVYDLTFPTANTAFLDMTGTVPASNSLRITLKPIY